MSEISTLLSVLVVGVIAGFFGSMVGGGSLLSIPFLMFLGLPPQVAIATDRFGGIGAATTALYKYWKAGKIVWKYVLPLSVISLIGSLIGANILLNVDPDILQRIAGVLLLILLPFVFLKRDLGVEHTKINKFKLIVGSLVYLIIQIFTGFFGAGTGPFIFYTLMIGFGLTIIESVATQIIPLLVLTVSSLAIFAQKGIIDYQMGLILLLGMAMGGYIGAHTALKKDNIWVRRLFIILVVIASVRLLLF
jgi:uncharacterized membrane protein YfcA